MNRVMKCFAAAICLFAIASAANAAIDASLTISSQDIGGGVFSYSLTLNNLPSSTSPIETLWFSWVPGVDFMSSSPLSTSAPSGWSANIEHGDLGPYYTDGYSVQYTTTIAPLNPGGTLNFGFTSMVTPDELAGNDSVYGYYPELTTYLYSMSVEGGASEQILAQAVPEPGTSILVAIGLLAGFALIRLHNLRRQPSRHDPS